MLQVSVDKSSMREIGRTIASLGFNVNKELATAVNKTTKQARTAGARELRKSIKLRAKVLKRAIYVGKPANAKRPTTSVNVRITLPLKFFEPQQRAAGVSYDIGAKDKSHAFITHAFVVKKFGNSVYKRAGKKRLPIIEQKMLFDSEAAKQAAEVCEATAREKLPIQVTERIRFLTLKAKGQLRGNQKK
jgi:hypothetical protein